MNIFNIIMGFLLSFCCLGSDCLLFCFCDVSPLPPGLEQGHKDPNHPTPTGEKIFTDEELVQLIDPILAMDDGNSDGFIDYPEFVRAQNKAASKPGGR